SRPSRQRRLRSLPVRDTAPPDVRSFRAPTQIIADAITVLTRTSPRRPHPISGAGRSPGTPGIVQSSGDDGPADDSDEAGQSDRDEGADDEPLPRRGRRFDLGEAAESLDRDDHGHEFGASEDDGAGDEGAFDDADPHAAAQHLDVLAAGALGPAARPRVRQRQAQRL